MSVVHLDQYRHRRDLRELEQRIIKLVGQSSFGTAQELKSTFHQWFMKKTGT